MKLHYSIELDVPAGKAWNAVSGQFGETGQWTSLLQSSYMDGNVAVGGRRVCTNPGGNQIAETITVMDHSMKDLGYEISMGRPWFVSRAENRWTVTALGSGRSRLDMSPDIHLKPWAFFLAPLMRLGLNSSMTKVLEEFKYWLEQGRVHPRKRKADQRRAATHAATIPERNGQ